ncbi:homoserine kinase [Philodulcilactobacillus myokoensis]|uniref:Homoserine kinase n=1 Tax=Philodulcilactobacillus myokoensis TaxID=2929573 RepID=A0A9W6B3F5_9LACO|nr:homoserine kinase [Philodulcilactobacillus myokoensis]GLB47189.1 homoserine kinase [Philodulcilactobacillus myokoensis]
MAKAVIRIPATASDLGIGTDSFGIAFQLYCTVIVEEETDHWRVNHALGDQVPHDSSNLIVQTILRIDPKIAPHQLTVMSDIPIGCGLGTSTSAIVAGIKVANSLGKMDLSLDQQINIGSRIAGSSENIAPAILGDMVISYFNGKQVMTIKTKMPNISLLAYIDHKKRKPVQMPTTVSFKDFVASRSTSNLFIAAVMNHEWPKASLMMEEKHIDKKYSSDVDKNLRLIRRVAHSFGIYGTFVSDTSQNIFALGIRRELSKLRDHLNGGDRLRGDIKIIGIDRDGSTVRGE